MNPPGVTDECNDNELSDFNQTLSELTSDSKPVLTALTIIAGEHLAAAPAVAPAIASIIEQRIHSVDPSLKLPALYLLDSIVKNIGREYIGLFESSLYKTFIGMFRVVDDSTRHRMSNVLRTWQQWEGRPLFSTAVLASITHDAARIAPHLFTPPNNTAATTTTTPATAPAPYNTAMRNTAPLMTTQQQQLGNIQQPLQPLQAGYAPPVVSNVPSVPYPTVSPRASLQPNLPQQNYYNVQNQNQALPQYAIPMMNPPPVEPYYTNTQQRFPNNQEDYYSHNQQLQSYNQRDQWQQNQPSSYRFPPEQDYSYQAPYQQPYVQQPEHYRMMPPPMQPNQQIPQMSIRGGVRGPQVVNHYSSTGQRSSPPPPRNQQMRNNASNFQSQQQQQQATAFKTRAGSAPDEIPPQKARRTETQNEASSSSSSVAPRSPLTAELELQVEVPKEEVSYLDFVKLLCDEKQQVLPHKCGYCARRFADGKVYQEHLNLHSRASELLEKRKQQ
eukprot:TRINITY_DN1195_c0_g5_i1.p1 TRINITY_DN1195_c0_g5~~TRINITY_DN1195_c0_g5_i1.p1  ORF type:complete len:500 (-),score=134.46 TRINITY_DN1195_c0_g5_i1:458-1957(-)